MEKKTNTTKRILIGSRAFFNGIKGFMPKDSDYITFGTGNFSRIKQVSLPGRCLFTLVKKSKELLIQDSLNNGPAMLINRYLVPEFAQEIELTIEDLKTLKPLIDKLDDKHMYLKNIYEAYIENNDFTLTEEQRNAAYEVYKEARTNKYKEVKE